VNRHDSALRRFPVCMEEEMAAADGARKACADVFHHWEERRVFGQVLDVNFGLVRRGTIKHLDEQILAVFGERADHDFLGAVALSKSSRSEAGSEPSGW